MLSDKELVELVRTGDDDAFTQLYHRHKSWVYSLAWRFCRHQDLALDVLQETFIYLLKRIPTLELTVELRGFLYPAVRHISINICKVSRRYQSSEQVLEQMVQPDDTNTNDERTDLAELIKGLTVDQREVILMRFVDDMKLTEIAAALQIDINLAKSRLYRGLKKLKEDDRVKKYFEGQ